MPLLARERAPDLCATARARSQHLTRNPLAVGPPSGLEVLESSGLVGVPVLFEVHPASGLGGIALEPVHLGQTTAEHQIVGEGRDETA